VSDSFERIVAVPVCEKRRLLVKRDLQESCMFVERDLLQTHISVSDSIERIVAILGGCARESVKEGVHVCVCVRDRPTEETNTYGKEKYQRDLICDKETYKRDLNMWDRDTQTRPKYVRKRSIEEIYSSDRETPKRDQYMWQRDIKNWPTHMKKKHTKWNQYTWQREIQKRLHMLQRDLQRRQTKHTNQKDTNGVATLCRLLKIVGLFCRI